jgi:type III pantothenate kinase
MWHPPAGPDGRGHLSDPTPARWVLIGNSRWHWAEQMPSGELRGWDQQPPPAGEEWPPPLAWAAVGPAPDPEACPPERQLHLGDVPLSDCPPWLGVDRALAGWGAWRERGEAVLVADAGTVLSLTRVDGDGAFRGGRLLAGRHLQLRAIATHTTLIPEILRTSPGPDPIGDGERDPEWPRATAAAMRSGVEAALAAAVMEATLAAGGPHLMLTGGDSSWLLDRLEPSLKQHGLAASLRPLLCLESLSSLRPAPVRPSMVGFRPDPNL